jgi:hypothetical protein
MPEIDCSDPRPTARPSLDVAKAQAERASVMDQDLSAPLTEKPAKTRRISRSPHTNEILSFRGRVKGTSAEKAFYLPRGKTLVRCCSIHDTDDGVPER